MFYSFSHLLFISVVALFPVINPIGSALIVNPYFSGLNRSEKKNAVKKIAFYAFFLCLFFLLAGHLLLNLFGITIPVIQLAGGIMICKTGWESLTSDKPIDKEASNADNEDMSDIKKTELDNKLFYPITFPITMGGGVISVLFTLGAHSVNTDITTYMINIAAIITAIMIMCILIIVFYLNTKLLFKYLNSSTKNMINRLMAFLLFCIGLQIASSGIKGLFSI